MSRTKILFLSLLGLGLIVALVLVLRPAAVPVTVTTAERGPFVDHVEDEGRTELRDPYIVHAPVNGFLRRVEREPGDRVARGEVLFELEALPAPALDTRGREQARQALAAAEARLERAEADHAAARAAHAEAEAAYRRREELADPTLLAEELRYQAQRRFEAAAARLHGAERGVAVARFEKAAARAQVAIADGERAGEDQPRLKVPAPIAGTVTKRHRCCEGPVVAGEPVLAIGDLDALEVRVDLLSMDAVQVRPGMRVVIDRWGGPEELEGEVRRVEPAGHTRVSALGVDEQRVPVRVSLRSPREEWANLGEGYRIEARFILWEGEDVLQVPSSALFRDGDRWALFVVDGGRAHLRHVTTDRRSGLVTAIREGLEAGTVIVRHPGDRLADGVRVAPE